MVSTLDSESSDPSSSLGGTYDVIIFVIYIFLKDKGFESFVLLSPLFCVK